MASPSGSGEPLKKVMKLTDKDEKDIKDEKNDKATEDAKDFEIQILRNQVMQLKDDNTWAIKLLESAFYTLNESLECLGGRAVKGPQDITMKSLVFEVNEVAGDIMKKVPVPEPETSLNESSGNSGSASDSGHSVSASDSEDVGGSDDKGCPTRKG